MTKVAVSGAAGRMGQTVCEAVEGADDLELTGRADPSLGVALTD
ncbi:MAG TPA: 4-hydroxy-tetrahydrodipicolinate reductase, partial [Solirubrobacteraceae bacterium]